MKTTIELPDALLISAKKTAAECRTTLRALIEKGLRREITQRALTRKPKRLQWVTVDGGLPPGLDIASREQMTRWIQESDSINDRG